MTRYFDLCYEDQQLLVVNKRSVVATMGVAPARPSLLAAVQQYLARDRAASDCFVAVTGRLDFPVAGLVVIAKSPAVADQLRQQQEAGSIRKEYHALVAGHVAPPFGLLTSWVLKSKRHRHVSIVPAGTDGAQIAKLKYRVLVGGRSVSKLSIELLTGRKHQIRAQLGHLGYPILGDRKYGSTEPFPEGIALLCRRIRLVHPFGGHPVEWTVDYPRSWVTAFIDSGRDLAWSREIS